MLLAPKRAERGEFFYVSPDEVATLARIAGYEVVVPTTGLPQNPAFWPLTDGWRLTRLAPCSEYRTWGVFFRDMSGLSDRVLALD